MDRMPDLTQAQKWAARTSDEVSRLDVVHIHRALLDAMKAVDVLQQQLHAAREGSFLGLVRVADKKAVVAVTDADVAKGPLHRYRLEVRGIRAGDLEVFTLCEPPEVWHPSDRWFFRPGDLPSAIEVYRRALSNPAQAKDWHIPTLVDLGPYDLPGSHD